MQKLAVCVVAALLAAPAVATAADELRLKNGDRLTGDVVKLEDGTLTFKTAHGQLTVPWAEVTALTLDAPMMVTRSSAGPQMLTLESVTLAEVTSLAPPEAGLVVSGGANAGFLATGGNTHIDNLHLDGEGVARRRSDRFTAAVTLNHAEDQDRETASNTTVSLNYDRFLTRRLFANGNAIFTNDRFRGIDLRSAFGAGIGYDVWTTARSTLSVDGGLGYVRENFDAAPDDEYAAAREGARLSVFLAERRVEAFHRHGGYFGLSGEDNLFIRMQNGVRFSLVGGLVSTVQLDIDYDRNPPPGRETTDRSVSMTFGYRFGG